MSDSVAEETPRWRRADEKPAFAELAAWIRRIPGAAPVAAGLLGGVAMGAYEMGATWIGGESPLTPLRQIGAGHPGQDPVLAGLLMHIVTSGFWGVQLGNLLHSAPARLLRAPIILVLGLAWGAILWALMGEVIGPLF